MPNNANNNWLWPALLTAAIAALGYVAKLLIETIKSIRAEKNARRTQLLQLYSLIKAGDVAFEAQKEHRNNLMRIIEKNHQQLIKGKVGFEDKMEAAFDSFNHEEKELHTLVRAITMHTINPINTALMEWLKKDSYYKARKHDNSALSELSQKLTALEAHLYLWMAKYTIWMPDNKAHALVYLADEKRHGVMFPKEIDLLIEKILKLKPMQAEG